MKKRPGFLKRIADRTAYFFIQGALFLIPFCITLFLVFYPLNWLTNFISTFTNTLFTFFLTDDEMDTPNKGHALFILIKRHLSADSITFLRMWSRIPYMNIIVTILFITILGVLISNVFIQSGIIFLQRFIMKIPILNLLYSYAHESTAAFLGKFNQPVSIMLYSEKVQKVGFITQEDLHNLENTEQYIAVYVPHSYAFSGELFLVDPKNVLKLDIRVAEAWQFILSGGLAGIKHPIRNNNKKKKAIAKKPKEIETPHEER